MSMSVEQEVSYLRGRVDSLERLFEKVIMERVLDLALQTKEAISWSERALTIATQLASEMTTAGSGSVETGEGLGGESFFSINSGSLVSKQKKPEDEVTV